MACSNNVVRCALTPKYRDVDLLVEMLTYNMGAPAVLHPVQEDECRRRFTPPISEFEIEDIRVRPSTRPIFGLYGRTANERKRTTIYVYVAVRPLIYDLLIRVGLGFKSAEI